jgi:hypothetical protein
MSSARAAEQERSNITKIRITLYSPNLSQTPLSKEYQLQGLDVLSSNVQRAIVPAAPQPAKLKLRKDKPTRTNAIFFIPLLLFRHNHLLDDALSFATFYH